MGYTPLWVPLLSRKGVKNGKKITSTFHQSIVCQRKVVMSPLEKGTLLLWANMFIALVSSLTDLIRGIIYLTDQTERSTV